jgi:hypothetical protein
MSADRIVPTRAEKERDTATALNANMVNFFRR